MTINELSGKLHIMYHNASEGEKVAMIHLFGIEYADEILNSEHSRKEIVQQAQIPITYETELSKGIKLAKYVTTNKKKV